MVKRRREAGEVTREAHRASVQLSEKARAQVLNGRPSRSIGTGLPAAWTPSIVIRALSDGTSKVHTPYLRPPSPGLVWIKSGSPMSYQVRLTSPSSVTAVSVQK